MFKDLHNEVSVRLAIAPQSQSGNITLNSSIIDRKGGAGGAFEALEWLIATGVLTTGAATFTCAMTEGDTSNLADGAAVAATDLLGAAPSFTGTNGASSTFRWGYTGKRRYVQLSITIASNAAAAFLSAVAVLAAPATLPTP